MFSFGFIYSFLGTFILEIFKLYKNKKINIMFYVYLVNLPLLLLNYYKLNVSTLFFSVILNGPISFLYVFSFVFLFLDKFYLLYEITITLFYKLFSVLNRLNCVLVFGKPSIVFVIFYYLLLLCFFVFKEQKRKIRYIYALLLFFLVFYQYCKPLLNPYEYVYFLNVGQGDCSIFFIPHSKDVVLVDTGGSNYKDIAATEIIPFLESKGVNKISKVILTHDDFDHSGALESLKNNFYVGDVVDSSLVKDIRIGNKIFINLNISEKRDNDGSIVLYGEYAGYNLLLMGDASKEIESKIMDNNMINVDIIKIGHHGSNTSSGYEFLDNINGKIAIISVGKNNIYGHPHDDVVENLEALGYVIFRTDENNDIGFGKNIFNLRFVDYFN
jgi:competence protein ComEC